MVSTEAIVRWRGWGWEGDAHRKTASRCCEGYCPWQFGGDGNVEGGGEVWLRATHQMLRSKRNDENETEFPY